MYIPIFRRARIPTECLANNETNHTSPLSFLKNGGIRSKGTHRIDFIAFTPKVRSRRYQTQMSGFRSFSILHMSKGRRWSGRGVSIPHKIKTSVFQILCITLVNIIRLSLGSAEKFKTVGVQRPGPRPVSVADRSNPEKAHLRTDTSISVGFRSNREWEKERDYSHKL